MVLMITIFWMWKMAMAVYTYTVLADAANEGLRYAIVHNGDVVGTTQVVTDYAKLSLHDTSGISVSVVPYANDGVFPRVTVTVTYTYVPYINIFTSPPVLHTFAEGRIVN
jgi:hypothetical protein